MEPTTIISTVRHGKKDADGSLLPEGKVQSAERAVDITHLNGDVILFHSGEGRVRDTIRVIGGNIDKQDYDELKHTLETEHSLQDYIVPKLHFLKNCAERSEYFSTWHAETNEELLESFLAGIIPDAAGYDAQSMAKNVAHVILTELQFSLLTSPESKSNFINGSHEPVIMSFLYYAYENFSPTQSPKEFLDNIGGSVHFAEGFDIRVYQHTNDTADIELTFRDTTVNLSLADFVRFLG